MDLSFSAHVKLGLGVRLAAEENGVEYCSYTFTTTTELEGSAVTSESLHLNDTHDTIRSCAVPQSLKPEALRLTPVFTKHPSEIV